MSDDKKSDAKPTKPKPATPSLNLGGNSVKKRGLQTRDLIALLSIVVSLVLVIACIIYIDGKADQGTFIDKQKPNNLTLKDMPTPDLEQIHTLPNPEQMKIFENQVDWVLSNPKELALKYNGFSAESFAWLRKQLVLDEQENPLPRFYDVHDIITDGLAFGTPTVVQGTLLNTKTVTLAGTDESWQWMIIESEKQQFLMLLVPGHVSDFTIGNKVKVVGRSMGQMENPGNKGALLPLIGARNVFEPKTDKLVTGWGELSSAPDLNKTNEKELFEQIDDIRPVLELRPYFYLLGKVKMHDAYDENIYEEAVSANAIAVKMMNDPSQYRGKVFEIKGRVLDIYEDEIVKREKPYNIEKVTRIYMWALEREPYTIEDSRTGEKTTQVRGVRHAYQFAVLGDVPDLKVGNMIRARGRFLKAHGIPLDQSANRDAALGKMQSGNFYSKLFIVPDVEIVPEAGESLWVKISLTVVMASLFLCVLWLYFIDIRNSEKYRKRKRRRISNSKSDGGDSESSTSEDAVSADGET